MSGIDDVAEFRWKTILPFCGRESFASAVFVVSTKASKQIANTMAALVTNDTFRRLALLNPPLYSISALFPVSAWLGSVANRDELAMNAKQLLSPLHPSAWKGNSRNFSSGN